MLKRILIITAIVIFPMMAFAQEGPAQEINLGQYSLPFIISLFLGVIFKAVPFADRWKPMIAIAIGLMAGFLAMLYAGHAIAIKSIVDYLLYGLVSGLGAVGAYEATRSVVKPRS